MAMFNSYVSLPEGNAVPRNAMITMVGWPGPHIWVCLKIGYPKNNDEFDEFWRFIIFPVVSWPVMMYIYPHVVPIFTAMCPARRILDTGVMSAPQEAHEYRPSSKTRRTAFVTLQQRPLVQPGTRCRFKRGWGGVRCRHQQLWKSTQSGWCFGTWLLFFHILGIIIPTD